MLFDIRKFNIHSLREFFREYIMIVVGILTALGIEQIAASRHHAHLAAEAREHIMIELRSNLEDVRNSIAENVNRREALDKLITTLQQDIKDGVKSDRINMKLAEEVANLSLGYALPANRHEEWDVAVANQSASYMDAADLRRFSAAYAEQREIAELTNAGGSQLVNGPRLIDALTDVEMQRADPVEVLKVFKQMTSTLNSTISNLSQMRKELVSALVEDKASKK